MITIPYEIMKTIALIEKNRCYFEKMEDFIPQLLYTEIDTNEKNRIKSKINDYIWSLVEPYIKFIEVTDEDFLITVCNNLSKCFPDKNPEDFLYQTEGSYSFPKRYLEIMYALPLWKEYQSSLIENMNNLACLFSLKHTAIENNCIIIANKYCDSSIKSIMMDSIKKDDITRVIRRRYFFSAILINNNRLIKYYYQNPSYLISKVFNLDCKDKIQKLSFNLLKYNLTFYFQYDKTKYLNKIATRINGSYQLYGDVLVIHELEENVFASISIHELKRLNVLSYGRLYDRQLKDDEVYNETCVQSDENGNPKEKKYIPYWNRYLVLNHRMLEWKRNKNKCINCNKEIIQRVICDKCYRVKFCSGKCKKEFDEYHSDECVKNIF